MLELYAKDVRETATAVFGEITLPALTLQGIAEVGQEAWGHAAVVAVFAIVLLLRTRAALRRSRAGFRAVTVIGCVLLVVNVVEAALPGVFPPWMRIEMLIIAAMMLALVVLSVRGRRTAPAGHR
ncbi:hypothetical protein [Streptomyces sp. WAC 06725]|uniref:hypothetical protein n=1 Tax=Streptomyces sp. WAC 06725 TaxID=2203209 RepID=UPI00163CFA8F|nr:hypothetical protein [Streptomyces sp. WAC 06725]